MNGAQQQRLLHSKVLHTQTLSNMRRHRHIYTACLSGFAVNVGVPLQVPQEIHDRYQAHHALPMTGLRYSLSARLLSTTLMLLNAMAALATHGGTRVCVSGHSAPAASGMDSTLYEYAHTKLKMMRLQAGVQGRLEKFEGWKRPDGY